MDEIQRLVEQVKSLVEQVRILAETVQLQTDRQDQLYKLQTEQLEHLSKMQLEQSELSIKRDTDLKQTMDNLEITNQALMDALGDVDKQVDDLSTIAAALLQYQKGQQSDQSATS